MFYSDGDDDGENDDTTTLTTTAPTYGVGKLTTITI